jgi:hypothetical protein
MRTQQAAPCPPSPSNRRQATAVPPVARGPGCSGRACTCGYAGMSLIRDWVIGRRGRMAASDELGDRGQDFARAHARRVRMVLLSQEILGTGARLGGPSRL